MWLIYIFLFLKGSAAGALYNLGSLTSDLVVADIIVKKGRLEGILFGLGISSAHILWSSLAAFALSITFINLHENQHVYTLIGSLILFYFAYRIYHKKKRKKLELLTPPTSYSKTYFQGLFFGFSSPSKIIGYAIIFAALGVSETDPELLHKIPLIFGSFTGSVAWWFSFSMLMNKRLHQISPKRFRFYQKLAAFLMAMVGVIGLITSLRDWR